MKKVLSALAIAMLLGVVGCANVKAPVDVPCDQYTCPGGISGH